MPVRIALMVCCLLLSADIAFASSDNPLERLLRAQVFNQAFEGFDYYYVRIEEDRPQPDGSREVMAVASGKFLESTKRMKVLLLIVGDQVIGGQVLEGTGLSPCLAPEKSRTSYSLVITQQEEVLYVAEAVSRSCRLCQSLGYGARFVGLTVGGS